MSLTHKIMPNFFLLTLILFTSLLRTPNVAASAFPSCLNFGQEAQNLTSPAATFVLGFFQRNNHTYLGIWYSDPNPDRVIVWVANRDNPVPSQQYVLRIAADGNAEFRLKNGDSNGSTNHVFTAITAKPSIPKEVTLCLGEDGNLVLTDRGARRGRILWQSFDSPTDTFLPGMNITSNSLQLISWKSSQDPAKGDYSFQKLDNTALLINNISSGSNTPYWDSTYSSSLHPELISLLRNNMASTKENSSSSTLMRVVMASNGSLQLWELFPLGMEPDGLGRFPGKWNLLWTAPRDRCDLQIACGGFGVCNADNSFKCKCLPGYEPSDPDKWESGDFCGGCRKRTSQCGHKVLSLPGVKLPLDPDISYSKKVGSEAECREHVLGLGYCIFKAYAFDANQTCLIWTNQQPDLTHIQEEYDSTDAQTLNILVNPSDIESGSRTCRICGTNVIPYPLSTQEKCGDSNYFSFECNTTNGQVYFKPPSGRVHKVALINPNSSTFYVQLATTNSSGTCNIIDINSKVFSLNNSSPFSLKNCSDVTLNDERVVVVELSWKPPPQPDCKSLADCRDWPETTCKEDADGRNVCLCARGFYWDSLIMNCSQDHAHMPQAADHAHMPALAKAVIAVVGGVLLLLLGTKLLILRLQRRKARHRAGPVDRLKTDDIEDIDIPYIDYESVLVVTDNFSDSNKLGAGGFGPVYRGKLADGNEVAVKRLSTTSVQGIEEFRNEVILIAKLQHRNLVRVLGYCMNEEEKILIYEYMPNKCLSSFLFDQSTSPSLDWKKRFNIILGIARGLVYLHQDSRLRIIHRDLKPSNILLDQDLNPKISDFGIARIVAGSDIATTTARVVGTYGYMSPEYALDGYFSVKSDVYSFGIILLEVISGRRSTSLFRFQNNLISLIGYSWNLWDKERALELVDQSIVDSCDSFEVQRCIKVGLLCVQEDPSDRPTMSTVLLMLGGGDMSLPYPKQPVFVARKPPSETASSSSGKFGSSGSNVELTTAIMEGR